jgi:hypothetical protein
MGIVVQDNAKGKARQDERARPQLLPSAALQERKRRASFELEGRYGIMFITFYFPEITKKPLLLQKFLIGLRLSEFLVVAPSL